METEYLKIPIREIGRHYADLRVIDPKAEAAMERSMRQFGQMMPVIVGRFRTNRYELVDGFKRMRAGTRLNHSHLTARVFPGGIHAAKAAMIRLNMRAKSISDLEKALVIRSLHRQDGLTQAEIAKILDRHPSWVCRKLSLVERLCEEITENWKLGLINMTAARELAKLPRGNQTKAMRTVINHNLTSDETARLVALLMKTSDCNHESVLNFPLTMPDDHRPAKSKRPSFLERLVKMRIRTDDVPESELAGMSPAQRDLLVGVMDRIEEVFAQIRKQINERWDCGQIHTQSSGAGTSVDQHACRRLEKTGACPSLRHQQKHGEKNIEPKRGPKGPGV